MPTISQMPISEIKLPKPRGTGPRVQTREEFDSYVQAIQRAPEGQATVFRGIDEPVGKFVSTLKRALKRNGVTANVKRLRLQNEVRAWISHDTDNVVDVASDNDDVDAVFEDDDETADERELELV